MAYNYYIYGFKHKYMEINKKNSKDLKIYIETLNYFRYSDNTVKIYSHYLIEFLNKIDKYSSHLVSNDIESYLKNYVFTSNSQHNQVINAIKFYYDKVLKKKYAKIDFSRPRKEKKLPKVIDSEILKRKILSITNLKHKALLSLTYSCGLRVSEVINLKIEDIDSERMLISIKQAKGRKDRFVPLSKNLLEILRLYYRKFKPQIYLFNGQFGIKYSSSSCNKLVKKYISKDAYMHLLRHSSFTYLLESGTDLRVIQSIAGHNSSKTTEIYTHISKNLLNKTLMPI